METMNKVVRKSAFSFVVALLLAIFLLSGCAHQKPQLSVSQYRFIFDNGTYRIRSITSADKSESYNELIGEKFMAADYDQDGVLDGVVLGDVSLSRAQKAYDYGINSVTKENKLRVLNPDINRYAQEKDDVQFEIRSFQPVNALPFNEFRVTDTRPVVPPKIVVLLDQNADGVLDDILKGSSSLEKFQSQYAEMIRTGLQKGELIKVNGKILVKEQLK